MRGQVSNHRLTAESQAGEGNARSPGSARDRAVGRPGRGRLVRRGGRPLPRGRGGEALDRGHGQRGPLRRRLGAHVDDGPYAGVPVAEATGLGSRMTAYRWHLVDPVPFTRSLRFVMEHAGLHRAPRRQAARRPAARARAGRRRAPADADGRLRGRDPRRHTLSEVCLRRSAASGGHNLGVDNIVLARTGSRAAWPPWSCARRGRRRARRSTPWRRRCGTRTPTCG